MSIKSIIGYKINNKNKKIYIFVCFRHFSKYARLPGAA